MQSVTDSIAIKQLEARRIAKEKSRRIEKPDLDYIRDREYEKHLGVEWAAAVIEVQEGNRLFWAVDFNSGSYWMFELPTIDLLAAYGDTDCTEITDMLHIHPSGSFFPSPNDLSVHSDWVKRHPNLVSTLIVPWGKAKPYP